MQREKTLAYYQQCILAAEALQAESLCITASGACYDLARALLMPNAVPMLKELAEFAGKHGVLLLLGSVLGEESPCNASTPVLVSLEEIASLLDVYKRQGLYGGPR